jgi:sodium transport system ATP-binding protein
MIRTEGLTKVFKDKKRGEVKAARELTFECKPGEVYGLLGLNGAGKTTTLRLIATMLRPTSGSVAVCDHDVVQHPEEVRSRIGYLTGNTGLYRRLTPREIITYVGRLHGMDEGTIRRRVDELTERLDMGEFVDTKADKLSSGMKQKASVARTVVHDPEVLILDEPTVGLDVLTSRGIVEMIGETKARGRTIIFSTHQMHEAEELCDRIGIIHDGRLLAEGTTQQLKSRTGASTLSDAFVSLVEGGA